MTNTRIKIEKRDIPKLEESVLTLADGMEELGIPFPEHGADSLSGVELFDALNNYVRESLPLVSAVRSMTDAKKNIQSGMDSLGANYSAAMQNYVEKPSSRTFTAIPERMNSLMGFLSAARDRLPPPLYYTQEAMVKKKMCAVSDDLEKRTNDLIISDEQFLNKVSALMSVETVVGQYENFTERSIDIDTPLRNKVTQYVIEQTRAASAELETANAAITSLSTLATAAGNAQVLDLSLILAPQRAQVDVAKKRIDETVGRAQAVTNMNLGVLHERLSEPYEQFNSQYAALCTPRPAQENAAESQN